MQNYALQGQEDRGCQPTTEKPPRHGETVRFAERNGGMGGANGTRSDAEESRKGESA